MILRSPRLARPCRVVFAMVPLVLSLASCFRGRLPAREYYRLRVPENGDTSPTQERDARGLASGSLAIVPYVAPGVYGSRSIVYRLGDSEYGAYTNREWALPVPMMLGMLTEDVLRGRPITAEQAVFDPPSPHSYVYLWRGLVRELEEVDRDNQVFAAVRFDARLVRAQDDSVLWSGSARLERLVQSGTMPAIVETLSQLSVEAVSQLLASAREALPMPAASAVRARVPDTVNRR